VEGTPRQREITDWFKTLPLWLDLGGLRVVHACWHQESMDVLKPLLTPDHRLTDEAIIAGSRKGEPAFEAIEVICKGPEIALPAGLSFSDKDGKIRHEVRVRWWLPDSRTFREAGIVPPGHDGGLPDAPLPAEWTGHPYVGPPVLFGHYWFPGHRRSFRRSSHAWIPSVEPRVGRWWLIDLMVKRSCRLTS